MAEASDIVVFGLTAPTCVLHDIGMDVSHGATVTIPADKALKSKDLWRAIGQRQLFRLDKGPGQAPRLPIPAPATLPPQIQVNVNTTALEAENRALREALVTQSSKLDSILTLLQSGVSMSALQAATADPKFDVVADETPMFIPSVIAPEHSETRIESQRTETAGASVAGAVEKLRELRQRARQ